MAGISKWPPPFEIRRSKRSKYITLHVDLKHGLQVVLPKGATQKEALDFLNSRRKWVEKHLQDVHGATLSKAERMRLPKLIHVPAIRKTWEVRYIAITHKKRITLREIDQSLVLSGPRIHNTKTCFRLLKQWLKRQAVRYLAEVLQQISASTELLFRDFCIRSQRTMWGSCSVHGDISLNYKLIFLPDELIRYVIIHELCHTVEHNHSSAFWEWVEKFDENYEQHRHDLHHAHVHIPHWA